jgi:hypothetical protein
MAAYNERLTREWQTLEERVEELEKEIRNQKSEIRTQE